jgi:hypothetical protein
MLNRNSDKWTGTMAATAEEKARHDTGSDDWKKDMTITVEKFAEIVRVGRNTAYESVRRGEVETIRVGNCIRVCVPPLLRKLHGQTA